MRRLDGRQAGEIIIIRHMDMTLRRSKRIVREESEREKSLNKHEETINQSVSVTKNCTRV